MTLVSLEITFKHVQIHWNHVWCMYIFKYVCMNVFMYVCMYVHIYVCMYECMFILNFCASNMNSKFTVKCSFLYFGPITQMQLKYFYHYEKDLLHNIMETSNHMMIIMIKPKVKWTYHLNFLAHAAISNRYSFSNSHHPADHNCSSVFCYVYQIIIH